MKDTERKQKIEAYLSAVQARWVREGKWIPTQYDFESFRNYLHLQMKLDSYRAIVLAERAMKILTRKVRTLVVETHN